MRALVKASPGPGLTLEEVAIPKIQDHEVLIKIKTTAICGTDLHIYRWDPWAAKTVPTPLIIGHEFVGEISELGNRVEHLKRFDRVSGEGHITCGFCRNCREGKRHLCSQAQGIGVQRNGAFADYLVLPAENVIKLPDTLSNDVAAILDPLGNAVHSALTFNLTGEDILITGAGPIGLMTAIIAAKEGAKRIVMTDMNAYRLNLAQQLGVIAINIAKQTLAQGLKSMNLTPEFMVGFEMSGNSDAVHTQLDHLYPGGNMVLLGIPAKELSLDWSKIILKGLTLKGIYGRKMFETWNKMIALLESGLDVSSLITHHFEAKDFKQAFELQNGNAGKILLHWS